MAHQHEWIGMRGFRLLAPVLACLALAAQAWSQGSPSPLESARQAVATYPAVPLSTQAREDVPTFGSIGNTTFKPRGNGPFPAVVLVHTCGGVKDAHMRDHTRELLALGYVVFAQDSFGPRGRADCGPNNSQALHSAVGVNDAYAALRHLVDQPFVDRDHVYLAGYSWGGVVAQLLSSPVSAEVTGSQLRFRATVGNYIHCANGGRPLISERMDRPLLMLLGGKDTETPASTCVELVASLAAKGLPVKMHLYPDSTHGWDKIGQIRDGYRYDADVARDATRRMVEFFEANR